MQLLLSWLFVPGDQQRMIDKALTLDLDAAIFDLGDAVATSEKDAARGLVRDVLAAPRTAGSPARFVRVHASRSDAFRKDLAAVVRPGLDGIVLAKVTQARDVLDANSDIRESEVAAGLEAGSTPLIAIVESARGLLNVREIAESSRRVAGLMFGAEDFSQDLGLPLQREGEAAELLYARSALVVSAAASNLQVIDQVWTDVRDPDGLRVDALTGRRLGFTGKACIHPDQIAVVHEAFRPSPEEIDFARRVDDAFRAAVSKGHGAIAVDGRLVDQPVVDRARRILELQQAIEQRYADRG